VNLILVETDEIDASNRVTLADDRAAHLLTVLKVQPGQSVRIGLIDGPVGTGIVEAIGDRRVDLRCAFEPGAPPAPAIDLLLALPRPKVMKRLWAQLAALGVGRIVLTNAARVERDYFDTHILRPDVSRPLLIEELQQARDTRVPIVSIHRRFRVLIEDELDAIAGNALRLVADPGAACRADDVIRAQAPGRVLVAVGPEGGWNDFERRLLAEHLFHGIGMGTRTLRTDTACVALLALINDAIAAL
jgi:RsmE family RNA methyltransferase